MAVLCLIVVVVASMTMAIQSVWTRTSARSEQSRAARQGLESIASRLSQATLNPYWVVAKDASGNPVRYERKSDLRFLSGPGTATTSLAVAGGGSALFFQAPTGFSSQNAAALDSGLNTWGYYIEYGPDTSYRPPFLAPPKMPVKYRFRLIEFTDPSDLLSIFKYTSGNGSYTGHDWYSTPLATASNRRVLAENIVALVVLPRLSGIEDPTGVALAPGYLYDSTDTKADPKLNPRHQLPPIVDLAVVAIDEKSANRLNWGSTPPDFGAGNLFLDPSNMDADLETLRKNIEAQHLSARVFRTSVPISAARWSTEQTN